MRLDDVGQLATDSVVDLFSVVYTVHCFYFLPLLINWSCNKSTGRQARGTSTGGGTLKCRRAHTHDPLRLVPRAPAEAKQHRNLPRSLWKPTDGQPVGAHSCRWHFAFRSRFHSIPPRSCAFVVSPLARQITVDLLGPRRAERPAPRRAVSSQLSVFVVFFSSSVLQLPCSPLHYVTPLDPVTSAISLVFVPSST